MEGAALNYPDLLLGRITLTSPTPGWAEVVFEQRDFGNFLLYGPVAAAAPVVGGRRMTFERDGVEFDVPGRRVSFVGRIAGRRTPLVLEAGEGAGDRVSVRAPEGVPEGLGLGAEALGAEVTRFFRTLLLDLAGVELRFAAMSFDSRARLRLRLRATIRRIPNPITDRI